MLRCSDFRRGGSNGNVIGNVMAYHMQAPCWLPPTPTGYTPLHCKPGVMPMFLKQHIKRKDTVEQQCYLVVVVVEILCFGLSSIL